VKRCKRCVVPETYNGSNLDKDDICSACRQMEVKNRVDWIARRKKLEKILTDAKRKAKGGYDCIAPVSFGKDSTFILYTLKKYGMNPLAVSFDHMWFTKKIIENRKKVCEKLGVDIITLSPNYSIVKKLVKKSIKKMGDVCWHCHAGIGSFPFRIAVQMNIPLIIWGEPGAEYGLGSYNEEHTQDYNSFKKRFIKGIQPKEMLGDGVTMKDLQPYLYPSQKDLKRVGVKGIFLGDYIPWNVGKQVRLIKEKLGWEGGVVEGSFEDFDNVECKYTAIHDYGCYLKRGFARSTHLAAIAIREGRMTREGALSIIKKNEHGRKPKSLKPFLKEMGISEDEFMRWHKRHSVR
jgi:N-acetyl sugar amidotransferase